MKIVKCVKCGRAFNMPDNFFNMIICEDCDPAMNSEDPKNLPKDDTYSLLAEVRAFLEKSRKEHYYCDNYLYICPKHPEVSCNEHISEDECICGADEYNKELDIILQKLARISSIGRQLPAEGDFNHNFNTKK